MRYPLIIFDFDGTLADSLGPALLTFNRIAPGLGLTPITDLSAARSMSTKELFRRHGVRFWQVGRVIRAFQAAAAEHAADLKLHPGIADLLTHLHSTGHRLGILSSNREDSIRVCLRANAVEDLFAFVVGYPKLFGKAKALRRIMRAEKVERSQVLFVGDELRDVEAAKKARVTGVAVAWGFHEERLLTGAEHVVRSPSEVIAIA